MTFQKLPLCGAEQRLNARPLAISASMPLVPMPDPVPFFSDKQSRIAVGSAAAFHIALFIALSLNLGSPPVKPPETGMQITFIEMGDVPPNGDPNGNSAPPRPSEAEAIEAKETPIAPQDKPAEKEAEPVSEIPTTEPTPEKIVDGAPPKPSSAAFSELLGTGTLALGAKTHGTGGGLDGDLAAAIGNAIATQIKACWDAPRINLPDDLSIQMTVSFHRDGSVYGEPALTRLSGDQQILVDDPGPFELAAVEAVKRCAPIKLPPNLYAYWSSVDVQIFSSVTPEDLLPKETPA